jgi:hypothetical protein
MSLSTVVSDVEAEGINEVTMACLITSRGVSNRKRVMLANALVGERNANATTASVVKAVGCTSGLCVAAPTAEEVAQTARACGGRMAYYADPVDLNRGEGLFDALAPAMEALRENATLLVVVDDADQIEFTKLKLERAAKEFLTQQSLYDTFSSVAYVTLADAHAAIDEDDDTIVTMLPDDARAQVAASATMIGSGGLSQPASSWTTTSAENVAAARTLGPAARGQLVQNVRFVRTSASSPDGSLQLVEEFGALCDAAVKQALDAWEDAVVNSPSSLLGCSAAKQIRSNLLNELCGELGDIFDKQLELLQASCFEDFRRILSNLLVSPNLARDMQEQATKSVQAFAKAALKLKAKSSSWNIAPAKEQYRLQLNEFCSRRVLAAHASGKFRPLPRKGVTVGFHWLLPKPFGNDYRQEPWMVHATDNMVYIPQDKLSDVSPDEVAAGDWRDKIVPCPAGNDMVYTQ